MLVTLIAGALVLASVPLVAQTLTPREIFYGKYEKEPPPAKPAANRVKKAPAAPSPQASAPVKPPAGLEAKEVPSAAPAPITRPDVHYATVKTETRPLVVRYSIQRAGECGYAEVDPDQTFRTGDQIRVIVQANDTGYLSIFQEGSSGKCSKLFPDNGDNYKLEQGRKATIPGGDEAIGIKAPAGVEKVYILFSRQPDPDKALQDALKVCGAEAPSTDKRPNALLAQSLGITGENRNQTFARDLMIEKQKYVEPKQAAATTASSGVGNCSEAKPERDEPAIYMINRTAGPNGRVVASFALRHQ